MSQAPKNHKLLKGKKINKEEKSTHNNTNKIIQTTLTIRVFSVAKMPIIQSKTRVITTRKTPLLSPSKRTSMTSLELYQRKEFWRSFKMVMVFYAHLITITCLHQTTFTFLKIKLNYLDSKLVTPSKAPFARHVKVKNSFHWSKLNRSMDETHLTSVIAFHSNI